MRRERDAPTPVVTVLMAERLAKGTFEGPAFSSVPSWLKEALKMGWVEESTVGALDYMTWTVATPSGHHVVMPGDRIRKGIGGGLFVEQEAAKKVDDA